MFIRQVTYSKNDPARPAYAAGQGIAVAAGGIKGKLFFSHKRHFLFTHVFAPPLYHNLNSPQPGFLPQSLRRFGSMQTNRIHPCRKTGQQINGCSSGRCNTPGMNSILQKKDSFAQTRV